MLGVLSHNRYHIFSNAVSFFQRFAARHPDFLWKAFLFTFQSQGLKKKNVKNPNRESVKSRGKLYGSKRGRQGHAEHLKEAGGRGGNTARQRIIAMRMV